MVYSAACNSVATTPCALHEVAIATNPCTMYEIKNRFRTVSFTPPSGKTPQSALRAKRRKRVPRSHSHECLSAKKPLRSVVHSPLQGNNSKENV